MKSIQKLWAGLKLKMVIMDTNRPKYIAYYCGVAFCILSVSIFLTGNTAIGGLWEEYLGDPREVSAFLLLAGFLSFLIGRSQKGL